MPTFTTIALQNLLEHRNPSTTNSSTLKNQQQQLATNKLQNQEEEEVKEDEEKLKARKRLNHIYISPALYTTPEPTPILDYSSSGSVSSSPYVFNRKGRGGGNSANRRVDGFEVQASGPQSAGNDGEEELVESSLVGGGQSGNPGEVEDADGDDDDDFVDPRCDSFSVASSSDLNDSGRLGLDNISNQIGEFYDAIEGKQTNKRFPKSDSLVCSCSMLYIFLYVNSCLLYANSCLPHFCVSPNCLFEFPAYVKATTYKP